MNDLVLNLLPVGGNRNIGKISSGMGMSVFNAPMFDSGSQIKLPIIPKLFGAPPNGGGGWAGSGILGTYYSNNNFTGNSFQRTDVRIDMPPTTVLPGGSLVTDPVFGVVGATNFSVKWVGNLIPKYTETYTLKLKTSGTSLVLKIGGSTIATATSSSGWVTTSYAFTSGTSYSVEVDYVQGTGPWGAQFHWLCDGVISFPEEAIGPATPIGVNNKDEQNCPANGGMIGRYETTLDSGNGPSLDSSGWPTGDFAFNQMSTPNLGNSVYSFPNVGYSGDGRTGVWTISFNGSSALYTNNTGQFLIGHDDGLGRTAVSLNGLTYYSYGQTLPLSSQTYHSGTVTGYYPTTNTTVALLDLRSGGWDNIQFSSTDRNGKGAPGGPTGTAVPGLTNVVCMRPSSIGSTTSLLPGTVVYPPYLAMSAPYCLLRNLNSYSDNDFVASVASPYTDWNGRATPVFNVKASNKTQYPTFETVPWEYRIMTANMTGKDLYVNLPQTASGNALDSDYTSSYIYQLANLIKNGSTFNGISYPGLLPHLCVYIEYGNENWNYSQPILPSSASGNVVLTANVNRVANTNDWQTYVTIDGYTETDLGGNLTYIHNAVWAAIKVKDASDLFRVIYGDAVMPGGPNGYNPDPRIRPIYEWQYGSEYGGYGFPFDSLNKIASHFSVPINHVYWGGGGGWYADHNPSGSTADQVFGNITLATGGLPSGGGTGETNSVQGDMDTLAQFGLHHLGYEGGFDFGTGGNSNTVAQEQASNDARIIPYVQQTLNQYFQAGGSLPVVFIATGGAYGFGSEWAVTDGIWDQPPYASAPPKLQAYLNSEQTLPSSVVAPSAWLTVPNTGFPTFNGIRGNGVSAGQKQTFLVPSFGYYSVGFDIGSDSNSPATVYLVVDGTIMTKLTIVAWTSYSQWVPVYFSSGLYGAILYVTGMLYDPNYLYQINPIWGVR